MLRRCVKTEHDSTGSSSFNGSYASFDYGPPNDEFQELYEKITNIFDENIYEPFNDFLNVELNQWIKRLALFIAVFFVGCFIFSPTFFSDGFFKPESAPNVLNEALTSDIRSTVASQFDEVKAPVVVLLAGNSAKTHHFIVQFKRLLEAHHPQHNSPLDLNIDSQYPMDRKLLEKHVFSYLDTMEQNRAVIMRGIDNLVGTTPLFLHAIADPDTTPFKHLLAIVTISPPTIDESTPQTQTQSRKCDKTVTDYLLERWNDELKFDKIYPIISRISAILMCFD